MAMNLAPPPPSRPPETVRAVKAAMQRAALGAGLARRPDRRVPADPAGCGSRQRVARQLDGVGRHRRRARRRDRRRVGHADRQVLRQLVRCDRGVLRVVPRVHRQRLLRCAIRGRSGRAGVSRRGARADRSRLAMGASAASAHCVQRARRGGFDRRRRAMGRRRCGRLVRRRVGHALGARTRRRAGRVAACPVDAPPRSGRVFAARTSSARSGRDWRWAWSWPSWSAT